MASQRPGTGIRLVVLLWFALALNYVDRQMVYSIFPALKAELHFTDIQLALIGSLFTWVYALGMPVAGYLADRVWRERMIVASMVLWSIATLGCGLSQSVAGFLVWRAVMGITEALYYPAAVSLLAIAHPGTTRSKAMGIHQSAQLAGIAIGGSYGGWMADHVNWRAGFAIAAFVGIFYSMVLARALPKSQPTPKQSVTASTWDLSPLIRSRCYLALALAFFAFCSMLWIIYAWLPSFLFEKFHLSMTESGFRATLFVQVSCGVGILLGSALADSLSAGIPAARLYIAAAGALLSAPFGYLTLTASTLEWAAIGSSAYGLFSGLMVANAFAALYDIVATQRYGLAAGLLNMMGGMAATLMIFLAGLWKNTLVFETLLRVVSSGCVLAAVLLIAVTIVYFRKERERLVLHHTL